MKDTGPTEIVAAIRQVNTGKRFLSPQVADRLIDLLVQKSEEDFIDPYNELTDREWEVLQLAAQVMTSVQMAEALSISPRTAEGHRANVMNKLGLNTPLDLAHYAIKRGLLPLE